MQLSKVCDSIVLWLWKAHVLVWKFGLTDHRQWLRVSTFLLSFFLAKRSVLWEVWCSAHILKMTRFDFSLLSSNFLLNASFPYRNLIWGGQNIYVHTLNKLYKLSCYCQGHVLFFVSSCLISCLCCPFLFGNLILKN